MPLAEDVRLDDIAGRTPGFVAADLAALAREAGVRAALRQKGQTEPPQVTKADFDAALEVVRPTSMADSSLELAKITLDDVGDMAEVKQMLTESVLWPLSYPDTFARLGVAATARCAALRAARLRQDVPGQGDRRHRQGQRAVGQGRGTAVEVGRRERTRGPRTVPPRPRGRADARVPGRGRRAGPGTRAGVRRRYHRSRGRRAADRARRRRVAAQRRRDRRDQPPRPDRPGPAATGPARAARLRPAAGRRRARGHLARGRPYRAARRRDRPRRRSPTTWTASRPPTVPR